jgi:hypothetical protein
MITRAVALGKVCAACGKERKKKGIMYDPETFMPYCDNPYVCNDKHPNSPVNLIARGGELKLIALEEAELKFNQYVVMNQPDKEIAEKIRKMVKNPTTVRIGDPRTAEFILELQKKFAFGSVAEAIRYCIETVRENEDTFYKDYVSAQEQQEKMAQDKLIKKEFEEAYEAEYPALIDPAEVKKEESPIQKVNKEAAEKAAKELEEKEPEKNDEEWSF